MDAKFRKGFVAFANIVINSREKGADTAASPSKVVVIRWRACLFETAPIVSRLWMGIFRMLGRRESDRRGSVGAPGPGRVPRPYRPAVATGYVRRARLLAQHRAGNDSGCRKPGTGTGEIE